MSHTITCPACLHTRKQTDIAPEWQCPNCQRAYAKASGATQFQRQHASKPANDNRQAGQNPMKWFYVVCTIIVASLFLWPVQPESRLYVMRSQIIDHVKSIGSTVGLPDNSQEISHKKAELQAYEESLRSLDAQIESARANVGTCSITGQPNQFILGQDGRPEARAKIEQLKEEIKALENKR